VECNGRTHTMNRTTNVHSKWSGCSCLSASIDACSARTPSTEVGTNHCPLFVHRPIRNYSNKVGGGARTVAVAEASIQQARDSNPHDTNKNRHRSAPLLTSIATFVVEQETKRNSDLSW
jgi:hypothetical protein